MRLRWLALACTNAPRPDQRRAAGCGDHRSPPRVSRSSSVRSAGECLGVGGLRATRHGSGARRTPVRRPILARPSGDTWTTCFPAPADLVVPDGEPGRVRRLRPRPVAVTTDLSGSYQDQLEGQGGRQTWWMPGGTLRAYLFGELLPAGSV